MLFSVIYYGFKSLVQRSSTIFIAEVVPKAIALVYFLKISFHCCLTKSNHERLNAVDLRVDDDKILLNHITDLNDQERERLNNIFLIYGQIVNRINLNNNRNNLNN